MSLLSHFIDKNTIFITVNFIVCVVIFVSLLLKEHYEKCISATIYKIFLFIIAGSSSFESQKMDRPSISVTSPMSPGMLRDVPQFLSGQLSVCNHFININVVLFAACTTLSTESKQPVTNFLLNQLNILLMVYISV